MISNPNNSRNPSSTLSAAELLNRLNNGEQLLLLDVRESIEYHTYNIGGTLLPLGRLMEDIEELDLDKDQEIIVLCKIGMRSRTAQSILQQMGYTNVKNLEGGLMAVRRLKE